MLCRGNAVTEHPAQNIPVSVFWLDWRGRPARLANAEGMCDRIGLGELG